MIGQAGAAPAIPAPGFADPTRDAQLAFRAVLDALANPTRRQPLSGPEEPPAALGRGLAAVLLTVLDEECATWLGGALHDDVEVTTWLTFHTGVRLVDDPGSADFVVVDRASLPALSGLMLGTEEAPHRSATVVLDTRDSKSGSGNGGSAADTATLRAEGPGIDGATDFAAPWTDNGFLAAWSANNAIFPRGVDLLLVDDESVAGLPRTTRLTPATSAASTSASTSTSTSTSSSTSGSAPAAGTPGIEQEA